MSLKSNYDKVGVLVFHNFIVSCDGIYCRGINPNEEETQDAINEIDMDGSGKVIQYHVIFVCKKTRPECPIVAKDFNIFSQITFRFTTDRLTFTDVLTYSLTDNDLLFLVLLSQL